MVNLENIRQEIIDAFIDAYQLISNAEFLTHKNLQQQYRMELQPTHVGSGLLSWVMRDLKNPLKRVFSLHIVFITTGGNAAQIVPKVDISLQFPNNQELPNKALLKSIQLFLKAIDDKLQQSPEKHTAFENERAQSIFSTSLFETSIHLDAVQDVLAVLISLNEFLMEEQGLEFANNASLTIGTADDLKSLVVTSLVCAKGEGLPALFGLNLEYAQGFPRSSLTVNAYAERSDSKHMYWIRHDQSARPSYLTMEELSEQLAPAFTSATGPLGCAIAQTLP